MSSCTDFRKRSNSSGDVSRPQYALPDTWLIMRGGQGGHQNLPAEEWNYLMNKYDPASPET